MFIEGFGFAGYRSFRDEVQRIGPCEKINIFIGQNNSGKSNIVLCLSKHLISALSSIGRAASLKFDSVDHPLGDMSKQFIFELGIKISGCSHHKLISRKTDLSPGQKKQLVDISERILTSRAISSSTSMAWFPYVYSDGKSITQHTRIIDDLLNEKPITDGEWSLIWTLITGKTHGHIREHWIPQTLAWLSPANLLYPDVSIVPAIRKVGDKGTPIEGFGGLGLIDRLARLQNPPHNQQMLKGWFDRITGFVRTVLDNATATLEIPYDRDMILVHMDGRTLPLSSLGTGVHEVIILAAAATVLQNQILCVEEPELHLHPLLQKKLIHYLRESTTNQYFITSHSAHLIDSPEASIFHVRYQNGHSIVDPVVTPAQHCYVCSDLGYRASDLLQANCIIWVEGPTDRIYLRHWINTLRPDFIDGVHYSIMFYGGRLLGHLTANDPEVDEFISLRRLNRYISIVIDSDRLSRESELNSTKKRVQVEFDKDPGFAWITQGREIENYVDPKQLEPVIMSLYPDLICSANMGPFIHCLRCRTSTGEQKDLDKVRVAREVTKTPLNLDVLDLKDRLNKLIDFISGSNGLP